MEKKTILLDISNELIDKIDQLNIYGDRSLFISKLLEEKLMEIEPETKNSTDINLKSNI